MINLDHIEVDLELFSKLLSTKKPMGGYIYNARFGQEASNFGRALVKKFFELVKYSRDETVEPDVDKWVESFEWGVNAELRERSLLKSGELPGEVLQEIVAENTREFGRKIVCLNPEEWEKGIPDVSNFPMNLKEIRAYVATGDGRATVKIFFTNKKGEEIVFPVLKCGDKQNLGIETLDTIQETFKDCIFDPVSDVLLLADQKGLKKACENIHAFLKAEGAYTC